jgi:hypothetical protein
MTVAADYPFLGIFWSMLIFFCWIIWIWLLIMVFADLFRRRDISGWAKTGWLIFVIILPYLGVFVYLITQGHRMAERRGKEAEAYQEQFDEHVRSVAGTGGAAAEIERAKKLLDSGTITQAEFDAIKQRALS